MEGISVEVGRLNNLICRLVRQCHMRPVVRKADRFKVTPSGYRYKDGGIYLVSRIKRRRVYLPLKDGQVTSRQIYLCLGKNDVKIYIYREKEVREDESREGTIYAYIGYRDAVTLSNGHVYGAELGSLVSPETERLNVKNHERNRAVRSRLDSVKAGDMAKAERIRVSNLGKKKYDRQKQRARDRTQNFINAELNRLLEVEKPKRVVITKPIVRQRTRQYSPQAKRRLSRSFGSYIRKRLEEKCRLYGIEVVAINPKGTGSTCSACGNEGIREKQDFRCEHCGYAATIAQNTARNIERMAHDII
jgi:IS605 OrfB family transposase